MSLGLTGGGGAIFAVPLLVYGLAVDPRQAVGASLITVAAAALVGFVQRARGGTVEFSTGLVFAVAGMLTAPLGASLSWQIPEPLLLVLFGLLMLVIAVRMWLKAVRPKSPPVCKPGSDNIGTKLAVARFSKCIRPSAPLSTACLLSGDNVTKEAPASSQTTAAGSGSMRHILAPLRSTAATYFPSRLMVAPADSELSRRNNCSPSLSR